MPPAREHRARQIVAGRVITSRRPYLHGRGGGIDLGSEGRGGGGGRCGGGTSEHDEDARPVKNTVLHGTVPRKSGQQQHDAAFCSPPLHHRRQQKSEEQERNNRRAGGGGGFRWGSFFCASSSC